MTHILSRALFIIVAIASSSAVASGYRREGRAERSEEVAYEIDVLSTATSHTCDASHTFRRTLTVCGSTSCQSIDISDQPRLVFAAKSGGRVGVATSSAYSLDGIVYGESRVDQVKTGSEARFVQTVTGQAGCLKSVAYQVRPLPL